MKYYLVVILGILAGCEENQVVSPPFEGDPFEFRAWNYSTRYYFVDTLYRRYYEPFYSGDAPVVYPPIQVVEQEVWVQRFGQVPDPSEVRGIGYITLGPRGAGYNPSFRNAPDDFGRVVSAPFLRLPLTDYELVGDGFIGVIRFNASIFDEQTVAIAYRCANGNQFGEFLRDVPSDTLQAGRPLILKIVKTGGLQVNGPLHFVAWQQMLKNIYSIGYHSVKSFGFYLDIFWQTPAAPDNNRIRYHPLLQVLGLDRYNIDGTPSPTGDGLFDFRPGRTIDLLRGDIIFPTLRPFDGGIRSYFNSIGDPLPDTSVYLYSAIYDTTAFWAERYYANRYVIRGKTLHND